MKTAVPGVDAYPMKSLDNRHLLAVILRARPLPSAPGNHLQGAAVIESIRLSPAVSGRRCSSIMSGPEDRGTGCWGSLATSVIQTFTLQLSYTGGLEMSGIRITGTRRCSEILDGLKDEGKRFVSRWAEVGFKYQ
ncbi:hypothetical protein HOY80DRAFT_1040206 [Tuber brumale]|nr:hypothetical protein HOY80DRAFT_1040206 [Tuber brumale]